MISTYFINRPIFASVISILIVLSGLISLKYLSVEQYPSIVPPEINISAVYPGASAETVSNTVASSLEEAINGVQNMIYMNSLSSNNGTYNLTVTFDIGTNPDQAAVDINNRIQTALKRLPTPVVQQGIKVNKRSSSILQIFTLYSPDQRYDPIFLSNYALINIIDELKRVSGVGDVSIFGAKDYAMRIWLQPIKLAAYGLSPDDVQSAIKDQNSLFPAGSFGDEPVQNSQSFTYNLSTQGQLITPEEFGEIILKSSENGGTIRLKDIARIELGSLNYGFSATFNGQSTIAIGIYLLSGANALTTAKAVEKKMQDLSQRLPQGINYKNSFNTTRFIELSVKEVIITFIEAILLVVSVIYLFIQNGRATLIPIVAIPISIIGTFTGMYLLGFSINLLTLFGMVLAIGIVVDDAIVVIENVERIKHTEKLSSKLAAIKAMNEVTGPIVAIVLILCAVFIPIAFMGGLTGEMYKQFAITITISTIISGFVALTLTPALCALMLKSPVIKPSALFKNFNQWFEHLTQNYVKGSAYLINRTILSPIIFITLIALTIFIYCRIPITLVPNEDQGYAFVSSTLLPASSLSRTQKVTTEMTKRIASLPEVEDIITLTGFDLLSGSIKSNAGTAFVMFKNWDQRRHINGDAQSLVRRMIAMNYDQKDALIISFLPPAIMGLSRTGGVEGYLQSRAKSGLKDIFIQADKMIAAVKKYPALENIQITVQSEVPQYLIHINRDKAKSLQVPLTSIFSTMQNTFGSSYVNDFTLFGRIFTVYLSADAQYRENSQSLKYIYVRANNNAMIPLSTLMRVERIVAPDIIERYNMFPSIKIIGYPKIGFSSGQAIQAIENMIKNDLLADYTVEWQGSAYQEKASSSTAQLSFVIGILMVFLILAALYESWSLPFNVILAVPFAVFGAVMAIWLRELTIDIYFQVGLLTLIGLSAKNAILIVEFAVIKVKQGKSISEAALEAAHLRFRPIIMTSIAFICGCLPLVLSTGPGAASRHSIGTSVIGGMLTATAIAIFFIPGFFCMIHNFIYRKK